MRIPGQKRDNDPDRCGERAGEFAEAIREGEMNLAWSLLSKETRGMRMGVWATRNNIDMQIAYRAGYEERKKRREEGGEEGRKKGRRGGKREERKERGREKKGREKKRRARGVKVM